MPIMDTPRYLVSFNPKQVSHRFCDVLILGSGLAGMRAALAVPTTQSVTVVTKSSSEQSNSQWAQGGIAAVWDSEDRFEAHAQDTEIAGQGLCDDEIVNHVVREAPVRVQELIDWGANFDHTNTGEISLTREGGHSASRILHAMGDATGREIMRIVLKQCKGRPNIQLIENSFTVDLITDDHRCVGAITFTSAGGIQLIWAKQTILATGGVGQLYRETTNPSVATGDGIALAFRAGAQLQDMEFMQFHPTVLYLAGSARFLISEAVRGEGAYLVDVRGERFMKAYDPRGELAPRDVVSQSIVRQMEKTRHPCVYLDQRHLSPEAVHARFPGLSKVVARSGLDFARDLIPVRPGAHYMIGGLSTNEFGQTTLANLWASGEVSATGLHGANRLASNSLLEALVFGESCGRGASEAIKEDEPSFQVLPITHTRTDKSPLDLDVADIRNALQSLMFRWVGIERHAESLGKARTQIDFWSQYVMPRQFMDPKGWELQNMLTVARIMVEAALARTESRGTHFRTDYPKSDEHWQCHLATEKMAQDFKRLPL